jgi:hypothetical protein
MPMTESAAILTRAGLDELVDTLRDDGYQVIGPVRRDDAIVLAELRSGADLPSGWVSIPCLAATGCGGAATRPGRTLNMSCWSTPCVPAVPGRQR